MNIELNIQNGDRLYIAAPSAEGEIKVETTRTGSAAKMTFNLVLDSVIDISEGNSVTFTVDGVPVFFGFIFSFEYGSDGIIKVVAFDQLVYLVKNKETYVYENKKASDILKIIASDFKLKTGIIEDTGYVIDSRIEDGQTLLDIIYNAIGLTLIHTGRLFCLYDDFGKLTLKNIFSMRQGIMFSGGSVLNYSYKSDIGSDTYNRVKLVKDNDETNKREIYVAQNADTIRNWGILQYYENVGDSLNSAQIKSKAQQLLQLKNKPSSEISIEYAGIPHLRAGNSVYLDGANMNGINAAQWFLIEKCSHSFRNDEHTMKLELRGDIV